MAKIVKMTNLTEIYTKKGNWSGRASRSPQILQKNCISKARRTLADFLSAVEKYLLVG